MQKKMQKCKKLKSTQKCKLKIKKLGTSYQYKKANQAEGLGTLDLVYEAIFTVMLTGSDGFLAANKIL